MGCILFLCCLSSTIAQNKTIKGTVLSVSDSQPLEGATVQLSGSSVVTITDASGNFSLSVPAGARLSVSFIGYETQNIAVENQNNLTIYLVSSAFDLSDVVVVGYGTQKKVNLTGAVSVASKEVFENKAVPNAVAAMQGTIPGVTITKSSGKPGAEDYQLQVRGASSVNNVGVLVIIDGVTGSLSDINPNDIESVSILKDAAAAAIYGSNAAGGVLLVTTKQGRSGKTIVEYSGMYGITNPARMPHAADFLSQINTLTSGYRNAGTPLLEWESPVRLAWYQGERLDETDAVGGTVQSYPTGRFFITPARPKVWQSANLTDPVKDYTKSNNPVQSHNVSIRGGDDKNTYFFSAGYYGRQGMLRYGRDRNDRMNARLNVSNKFNKYITLNSSVAFTNSNIYQPGESPETILKYAYRYWSSGVTYGPDGEYFASHGLWPTKVQVMKEGGENNQNSYNFNGRSNLQIKNLVRGLEVNVVGAKTYGINKQYSTKRTMTNNGPSGIAVITNPTNSMSRNSYSSNYSSLQAYATYIKDINRTHNFSLLGGYSYEDFSDLLVSAGASTLVTNDFFSLGWGDAKTKTNNDQIATWATAAFFGRFTYNFKEKYLFEANLRYDGSSRLAPGTRWNTFPSFSAGWNIDKEDFFQGAKAAIQSLKLRASWGQLGNSNALGLYDYIALLNASSNLPFNNANTQYIYQTTLASPTKTWETVETSNVGIDLSTFNNRLIFTADAYIKRNKNMLANLEVPSIIGIGLSSYNLGELETRGWELGITWKEMSRKFKYWITVNLSDNTNKLLRYEGKSIVNAGTVALIEGMPINTIWGYKTGGLFQSDQEYADYDVYIDPKTGGGDVKYLDINGDKKIDIGKGTLEDHGDLVRLGDANPRYLFGVSLGFQWNGFDFGAFLQGVGKRNFSMFTGDIWNSPYTVFSDAIAMPLKEQLDYWTPENTEAFWPRPYVNGLQSYWPSDYWIQDAAYIRLKNIEIGYTIPQALSRRARINKARIFFSGQDLWETTKTLSYIDPESPNNLTYIYPFYRTVSVGLNLTFQ